MATQRPIHHRYHTAGFNMLHRLMLEVETDWSLYISQQWRHLPDIPSTIWCIMSEENHDNDTKNYQINILKSIQYRL